MDSKCSAANIDAPTCDDVKTTEDEGLYTFDASTGTNIYTVKSDDIGELFKEVDDENQDTYESVKYGTTTFTPEIAVHCLTKPMSFTEAITI